MRHHRKRSGHAAGAAAAEVLFRDSLFGESGSGRRFDPRQDRKTLQLCRQAERALTGEVADLFDVAVAVDGVQPMGSAGLLLVRVTVPAGTPPAEVAARLDAKAGALRAAVAAAICRKRAPALTFVVVPSGIGGDHA